MFLTRSSVTAHQARVKEPGAAGLLYLRPACSWEAPRIGFVPLTHPAQRGRCRAWYGTSS